MKMSTTTERGRRPDQSLYSEVRPRRRHESWGMRRCVLELETYKWVCRACGRSFWQRFPGLQPRLRRLNRSGAVSVRSTLMASVAVAWRNGKDSRARPWNAGFGWYLELLAGRTHRAGSVRRFWALMSTSLPGVTGYATTFCDLKNHKVHDVVLGRSEASLESYLERLEGKDLVRVVCMDLAASYRALVRKHFPQARIVADRFHVICSSRNLI